MLKPAQKIILSKIIGFLVFLILLVAANISIPYMENDVYTGVVGFFNANIILLMTITFIGMLNDLLWSFKIPFNMPAPLTSGVLSMFVITFFYRVWLFIEGYLNTGVKFSIWGIYIIVFLIAVISGYVTILLRLGKSQRRLQKEWENKLKEIKKNEKKFEKHKGKNVVWEEVVNEFKLVLYNIGKSINNLFEESKKRKK